MHSSSASKNKTTVEYLVFTSVKCIDYIVPKTCSTLQVYKREGVVTAETSFQKKQLFVGYLSCFPHYAMRLKARTESR